MQGDRSNAPVLAIPIEREVGFMVSLRSRGPDVRATRHAVLVPPRRATGSTAEELFRHWGIMIRPIRPVE